MRGSRFNDLNLQWILDLHKQKTCSQCNSGRLKIEETWAYYSFDYTHDFLIDMKYLGESMVKFVNNKKDFIKAKSNIHSMCLSILTT